MSGATTLITGGAGFVGRNLAHRLLAGGERVVVLDDLSRRGVERNVAWLRDQHGSRFELRRADVRDRAALTDAVRSASSVFHLAAQVAVTKSLEDPLADFDVNAGGTLALLEAARSMERPPFVLFTSTNKVYGALGDVPLADMHGRCAPVDPAIAARGISELRQLDFHSPYGCSKGAADQYVVDYARTFGLPATVFRMSCVYGPGQHGHEDQGWVAHFLKSAIEGKPIRLFGDGLQVRDLLFVDDLVDALLLAREHMKAVRGRAFNIGGGPSRQASLRDVVALAEELTGRPVELVAYPARPGDQRYYVADTRCFGELTGWAAQTSVREGVQRLYEWLVSTREAVAPRRGGA